MSLRVAVIDDEPPARRRLRRLIASEPDVEVVAEAATGLQALEVIREHEPDVVFLDVQMPDLDGFGVLAALGSSPPAVVFVTAYDEHCLRAFDVHAVDYLLKPFENERFFTALVRARAVVDGRGRETHRAALAALLRALPDGQSPGGATARLAVRVGETVELISADTIGWIEADGNYVTVHVASGRPVRLRRRLRELARDLPSFVRIHRSTLVNTRHVKRLHVLFHGEYLVELTDGTRLRSSRTYAPDLQKALGVS